MGEPVMDEDEQQEHEPMDPEPTLGERRWQGPICLEWTGTMWRWVTRAELDEEARRRR